MNLSITKVDSGHRVSSLGCFHRDPALRIDRGGKACRRCQNHGQLFGRLGGGWNRLAPLFVLGFGRDSIFVDEKEGTLRCGPRPLTFLYLSSGSCQGEQSLARNAGALRALGHRRESQFGTASSNSARSGHHAPTQPALQRPSSRPFKDKQIARGCFPRSGYPPKWLKTMATGRRQTWLHDRMLLSLPTSDNNVR